MRLLRTLFLAAAIGATAPMAAQQYKGKASYYSNALHGRRMSDGTTYDKNSMTCAHRSLPLGTLVKVTNPKNGKSVVVKVTDRGPHHRRQLIDLSRKAAEEIDILRQGVADVVVEVVKKVKKE